MTIQDNISQAFYNLSQNNTMLYDYWLSELYDVDGEMIQDRWNELTLKMMEVDEYYDCDCNTKE